MLSKDGNNQDLYVVDSNGKVLGKSTSVNLDVLNEKDEPESLRKIIDDIEVLDI